MINNTIYSTGGKVQNPLAPPANLTAKAGNAQVTLTWTDPPNTTVSPSGQTLAEWAYTRIVRKTGSQPTGPHDGELVVSSSVRDQYATTGFVDTGLVNDTLYYYAAYAYNTDGVVSEGAFASATPIAGTPLAEQPVGTIVTVLENGTPQEWRVVHHGIPEAENNPPYSYPYGEGCNGTWLQRVNLLPKTRWNSDSKNYNYQLSVLHSYLNGTIYNSFPEGIRSKINLAYIPISSAGSGNTSTMINAYVFALGRKEFGLNSNFGAILSYYQGTSTMAASRRIFRYNGTAEMHFTREVYNYQVRIITDEGAGGAYGTSGEQACVAPAMVLSNDTLVDENLAVIA